MQNGNGNDFKCEWVYILPAAAIYPVFHCSNGCAALDHWCACSLRRAAAAAAQYARIHLLCVCAYTRAACGFHYACDLTLSLSLPPSLSLSGFSVLCYSFSSLSLSISRLKLVYSIDNYVTCSVFWCIYIFFTLKLLCTVNSTLFFLVLANCLLPRKITFLIFAF